LKRRLQDTSGNALYYTVVVTESLMKNCTSDLHTEVLNLDFLTVMKNIITSSKVSYHSWLTRPKGKFFWGCAMCRL